MKTGKTVAIILAGGNGSRMGGSVKKQYLELAGRPLMAHTLASFQKYDGIDEIVLVISEAGASATVRQKIEKESDDQKTLDFESTYRSDRLTELCKRRDMTEMEYVKREIVNKYGFTKVMTIVPGGAERYHSVYAGLMACRSAARHNDALADSAANGLLMQEVAYVLIHDGARAFISKQVLDNVMAGLATSDACVAAVPVKDTIKKADSDGFVTQTFDRKELYAMQTPQAFSYPLVMSAYRSLIEEEQAGGEQSAVKNKAFITDDAMVVEKYFPEQKILLVEGSYENIKVTTPDDLAYGEYLLGH